MSPERVGDRIAPEDHEKLASAGVDMTLKERSASFLQQDARQVSCLSMFDGVDILSTDEARRTVPEAGKLYGRNFALLGRAFPEDTEGGYFIRVKKGVEVSLPIQACLLLKQQGFHQRVHNVIIVEEGARVHLITGCAASKSAREAMHLGISEFFIHRGGYLNFTMIHSWREDVSVKPMSIAHVEDGATFVSNFMCLRPVKEIVMYPTAVLAGEGARAHFNSLLLAHPGSYQDIGGRAILRGKNAQAEIVSRALSRGGTILARGHLKAEAKNVKAHLECKGIILSEEGIIHAIPEVETAWRDVDLSHEAAIGRISKEEIEYLCARGLSEQEAQSVIIRGFMDVNILGLPQMLKDEIAKIEVQNLEGAF